MVLGEKGWTDGQIALTERPTGTVTKLSPADAAIRLKARLGPVL